MARTIQVPSLKPSGTHKTDLGVTFDSMSAFVDHCQALPNSKRINGGTMSDGWVDNLSYDSTCHTARTGDLSRVPSSDKLMSKLEGMVSFETRQMETVDAVAGGVPNVPAMLANNPLAMRRRQRIMSQGAPLNIILDLGSSASITSAVLEKRGAAVLALVRILSAQRPVNLFIGVAFSPYSAQADIACGALAVRIDTSPLDLARAAFAIGGAAFPRQLMYSALESASGANNNDHLPFPYTDVSFYRARLHKFWERFVSVDSEETLVIPPLYSTDDFADAETWLREMVGKYSVMAV